MSTLDDPEGSWSDVPITLRGSSPDALAEIPLNAKQETELLVFEVKPDDFISL